jgi:hypothetical protein
MLFRGKDRMSYTQFTISKEIKLLARTLTAPFALMMIIVEYKATHGKNKLI